MYITQNKICCFFLWCSWKDLDFHLSISMNHGQIIQRSCKVVERNFHICCLDCVFWCCFVVEIVCASIFILLGVIRQLGRGCSFHTILVSACFICLAFCIQMLRQFGPFLVDFARDSQGTDTCVCHLVHQSTRILTYVHIQLIFCTLSWRGVCCVTFLIRNSWCSVWFVGVFLCFQYFILKL